MCPIAPPTILGIVMEQDTPDSVSDPLSELPLFPLNVVLFPGMPLPLHIFEERYKTMIGQCLETDGPFGIVLIKEGPEVGGSAEPFSVGTTARILRVERLESGRMNILTQGRRRFSIHQITQREPYLKGRVEFLMEQVGEPSNELVGQAQDLFAQYLRGLAGLRGGWVSGGAARGDIQTLAYSIAHFLDLPPQLRQQLLEVPSAQDRLVQELPLLHSQEEMVRRELIKRSPFQGFRLN